MRNTKLNTKLTVEGFLRNCLKIKYSLANVENGKKAGEKRERKKRRKRKKKLLLILFYMTQINIFIGTKRV